MKQSLFMMVLAIIWSELAFSASPSTKYWEKFYTEDGIELFRASEQASGIIPFKAEATIDADMDTILSHLLDAKGRANWAPKLDRIDVHKMISPNHYIFSEYYKTPWPATDRQFLLEGKIIFKSPHHILLTAQNAKETKFESKDHIVCDVKFLNFELTRVSNTQTKISFSFLGDMKGWMPIWLINLIQKKWPMRFIQGLKRQLKLTEAIDSSIYNGLAR